MERINTLSEVKEKIKELSKESYCPIFERLIYWIDQEVEAEGEKLPKPQDYNDYMKDLQKIHGL